MAFEEYIIQHMARNPNVSFTISDQKKEGFQELKENASTYRKKPEALNEKPQWTQLWHQMQSEPDLADRFEP